MDGCDYNALQNSITDFYFLCNTCLQGQLPFSDNIDSNVHGLRLREFFYIQIKEMCARTSEKWVPLFKHLDIFYYKNLVSKER